MNSFLMTVGAILVIVLAALFGAPYAINWNKYREDVALEASRLLGREVRVGGPVKLRLLPAPYLRVDNVRVADVTGRFDRPILRVKSLKIWLSVTPLLRGVVEVREIDVDRPRIRLAIDANGRGNWAGLGESRSDAVLSGHEIALRDMNLRGATIELAVADGKSVRIDEVTGNLTAVSRDGPFKFVGTLTSGSEVSDLKASSVAAKTGGGALVKIDLKRPKRRGQYKFKGKLSDVFNRPRLLGTFRASVPASSLVGDDKTRAKASTKTSTKTGGNGVGAGGDTGLVELRGSLSADASRMRLGELQLSFESQGRPQLISGELLASWTDGLALQAKLASRWLDFDRLAGAKAGKTAAKPGGKPSGKPSGKPGAKAVGKAAGKPVPWRVGLELVRSLHALIPSHARASLSVRVGQANLGGDLIEDLAIEAAKQSSGFEIRNMSLRLPGNSRLQMVGVIVARGGDIGFDGPVRLHGQGLRRFAAWLAPAYASYLDGADRPFSLTAQAKFGPKLFQLDQVSGGFGESAVNGHFRLSTGGEMKLDLFVDADRLNLGGLKLLEGAGDFYGVLVQGRGKANPARALKLLPKLTAGDRVSVDVRVGKLVTRERTLTDVKTSFSASGEVLALSKLAFSTADGSRLRLDGQIDSADGATPSQINFFADARSADGLATIFGGIAPLKGPIADKKLHAVALPLRLSGRLVFGGEAASTRLQLDGMLQRSRLTLAAAFAGAPSDWREKPLDVTAKVYNERGADLLAQLFPEKSIALIASATTGETPPIAGELALRASGYVNKGMTGAIVLQAGGLSADYAGDLTLRGERVTLSGPFTLRAPNSSVPLLIAGMERFVRSNGQPLTMAGQLVRDDTGLRLASVQATLGERALSGSAHLVQAEGGGEILDLELSMDTASIEEILAFAVGPPTGRRGVTAATAAARVAIASGTAVVGEIGGGPWSDGPFDLAALEGTTARVSLRARELELLDGLALTQAKVTLDLKPGNFTVSELTGRVLGGEAKLSGTLERRPAGAALNARIALTGGRLSALAALSGTSGPKGSADLELEVSGEGVSPSGLMAVLKGQGKLTLNDFAMPHFNPRAVVETADAVMSNAIVLKTADVREHLKTRLADAPLKLDTAQVALTVKDGSLKTEDVKISRSSADLSVNSVVDLTDLTLRSTWFVAPSPLDGHKYPPVGFAYRGRLSKLGELKTNIYSEAFERELSNRKVDEKLEEIKRLRRKRGLAPEAGGETGSSVAPPGAPGGGAGDGSTGKGVKKSSLLPTKGKAGKGGIASAAGPVKGAKRTVKAVSKGGAGVKGRAGAVKSGKDKAAGKDKASAKAGTSAKVGAAKRTALPGKAATAKGKRIKKPAKGEVSRGLLPDITPSTTGTVRPSSAKGGKVPRVPAKHKRRRAKAGGADDWRSEIVPDSAKAVPPKVVRSGRVPKGEESPPKPPARKSAPLTDEPAKGAAVSGKAIDASKAKKGKETPAAKKISATKGRRLGVPRGAAGVGLTVRKGRRRLRKVLHRKTLRRVRKSAPPKRARRGNRSLYRAHLGADR